MDVATMRAHVGDARVARLATVNPDGSAHVVPFVYALDGETVYTSVDDKPKRSTRLRRTSNLERDPRASILVDHYEDDWEQLWWVRLDGRGRVVSDPDEAARARVLLASRYDQYDDLSDQLILAVDIDRWSGWAYR